MTLSSIFSSVLHLFKDKEKVDFVFNSDIDDPRIMFVMLGVLIITTSTTILMLFLYLRKDRQCRIQQQKIAVLNAKNSVADYDEEIQCYIQSHACRSIIDAHLEQGRIVPAKDWSEIYKHIDQVAPLWKETFATQHPISTFEYQMCCLIKLGYSPANISVLLAKSPSAITMARKRLFSKIHKTEGTAKDFDSFILSIQP